MPPCLQFCRRHGALDSAIRRERERRSTVRGRLAVAVGLAGALVLALAEFSWPGVLTTHAFVAWSALWIVVFPLIGGVGPRRALVWGLVAASFTPLAAMSVGGRAEVIVQEFGSMLGLGAPVVAAALLGALVAHFVQRLRLQVSTAEHLGVYQLETRIAQGGMGEVWRARHALLSRPAAVKLIKPRKLSDGSEVIDGVAKQRFEREAQITASLQSAHTIELYDFGVTSTGTFYYVMELLGGSNLEQLVEREGPLAPERALKILRQILDSLAEAHERGLVHRDIKPANIVVSTRGVQQDFVKVLDFGLAQAASASVVEGGNDKVEGTPAFMAPEAVTHDAPIDARADIYSLGCVAYWLLTGTLVFDARNAHQMAVAHAVQEPERLSERLGKQVPEALETIVLKCLAKNPAKRPESALALLAELDAIELALGSNTYAPQLSSAPSHPLVSSAIN